MTKITLSILLALLVAQAGFSQSKLKVVNSGVIVSDNPQSTPDPNALLDLNSSQKGFLLPRLTNGQRDAMASTSQLAEGLMIYNLTIHCIQVFNGTLWIDLCAPGALITLATPGILQATAIGPTQIELAWTDNSDNEEGFEVWYKNATETEYLLYTTTGAGGVSQSIPGLEEETGYDFRVRAVALSVNSAWSNVASATTHPFIGPPSDLLASAVSISQVNLTWVDNSDNELGFDIWYKKVSDPEFIFYGTTAANATSESLTGLQEATEYVFRVRGAQWPFHSEWSSNANATTLLYLDVPSALMASTISTDQINLTWTDNSDDEGGFEVWYRKTSEQDFTLFTTTSANAASQSITALDVNTAYVFRIRGKTGEVYSEWSGEAEASTFGSFVLTEAGEVVESEDGLAFLLENAQ